MPNERVFAKAVLSSAHMCPGFFPNDIISTCSFDWVGANVIILLDVTSVICPQMREIHRAEKPHI
jgi:hypothetical protein